jgi:uncharacterized protein
VNDPSRSRQIAAALRRIFVFIVVSALAIVIAEALIGPLLAGLFGFALIGIADDSYVTAIGLLAGTAVCVRYIDKRPWRDVWLDRDAARPNRLALGFVIGAFSIGLPTALLIVAHWLRVETSVPGSWWGALVRISATLLPAALLEELLTRGYILAVLRETWGWTTAVVVTSVGFGLLHLMNAGANTESVALVTFAGFFLAAVLIATRSLYAAWMAHFAWNWTMAVVFHVAVSGLPLEAPAYRYVDAGPDWATGGAWGPEGGVPAALGMIGGMAFLFSRRRRRPARAGSGEHDTFEISDTEER